MASCSTSHSPSTSQLSGVLPQTLSKQKPSVFGRYEETFSDENSPIDDDYVFSDLKTLAAKDKKLSELIPQLEALKRARRFMKTFLQEKAEKIRRGEDEESTDSEGEEDVEAVVPLVLAPFFHSKGEIMRLELRSFIFKLWLRRIELTREEDEEKYFGLQDLELAIHCAQAIIMEYREFIYKEFYNIAELLEMCPFHLERLENASSKVIEEKEKAGFEMIEEDVVRFGCQKARLCALLGLKLDFLDRLEEMPPEHYHHRTLRDWIEIFLQNNIESVVSAKKTSLTKELLDSIGFDPLSSAVETILVRSSKGSAQHHIEASEWAEIFIKDEFKYNPLISSLFVKFPFQGNLTNSWFQLPSITREESENPEDICHVLFMNLVTKGPEACRDTQSMLSDFVSQNEENIVLFHGTDHASAVDILFQGIDLCAGRKKRDFSCGSGFYLTKNLEDALNWAHSTTMKPAILVFQVDRQYLDDARKLNLSNDEERWREIVSSFRSAKRTAKTRKQLSSVDLIEGPMATVRRGESSEDLVLEPKPSSYQMCLISDDFAEEFRKTLFSIVFLDIS